MKRIFDRFISALLCIGILVGLVVGFVQSIRHDRAEYARKHSVTDPRIGLVYSGDYAYKFCDGRNLVYKSPVRGGQSVAVSPNDPACVP